MNHYAAMNLLLLPERTVFICDTYVNFDPTAEMIAEIDDTRGRGNPPLRPHAESGAAVALELRCGRYAHRHQDARGAARILWQRAPELEVDGEMQGDMALSEEIRRQVFPGSRLKGEANLLVMPNLDAANIAFNLLKTAAGGGITVGPMLLGAAKPVHIITPSATVRRIVNITAVTVVDAHHRAEQKALPQLGRTWLHIALFSTLHVSHTSS